MASELDNYISDALKKGYSENYLRQSLLSQGWQASDINQAFASVRGGLQSSQPAQTQPQSIVSKSKRMKLRRIGVLSSAKISAVTAAIIGLIVALFAAVAFMFIGSFFSALSTPTTGGMDVTGLATNPLGAILAAGLIGIVLIPVLFAIMGFISGAIFALIYNLVAGTIGGYEVEFEE